jgi:hypothetical protein
MKCECGGKSAVTTTRQLVDGILRRRKCDACAKSFATLESYVTTPGSGVYQRKDGAGNPKPKPDKRGLYTEKAAAEVKKLKVTKRRDAEDRKDRVSNYYIEDDFDGDY